MTATDPTDAPENLATVLCVECGRVQERDKGGHVRFGDIAEVAIYCPECAEREFGGD